MKPEVTKYFYKGGLNCAESTLRCLIEEGVIDAPPEAVRMMTRLWRRHAAGHHLRRSGGCGGGAGVGHGRTEPGQSREASARVVREFLRRFEESFGTLDCRTLQATYVKDHALKSEGMYRSCTVFVEKAVELVREILEEGAAKIR